MNTKNKTGKKNAADERLRCYFLLGPEADGEQAESSTLLLSLCTCSSLRLLPDCLPKVEDERDKALS